MSETTSQITLSVTNIADAVKLIDYAADQGAYKGTLIMRHAIMVRDVLDAFVTAANMTQVNKPDTALDEADAPI